MWRLPRWAPWLVIGTVAGCHLISGLAGVEPNESGNATTSSTSDGGDNSGAAGPGGSPIGGEGGIGGTGGAGDECSDPADCPGEDTTCAFRTCDDNICGSGLASKGTECTEDGGELCDGMGNCVPGGCIDRQKNGNETDIDCGGDECLGCGEDQDCLIATDCETLFCDSAAGSTCQKCSSGTDCEGLADHYCNVAGFCKPKKALGLPCNTTEACLSSYCFDMVCCDADCSGSCDLCNGGGGECKPIGVGKPGEPSCTPYVCDGASGECPDMCTDDANCIAADYCDTQTNTCEPKKGQSESCGAPNECINNYCVDDTCCAEFECADKCMACNVAGLEGDCAPIPGCT